MSRQKCKWTVDFGEWGDSWDAECGGKFQFTTDGPKENDFQFCPYCGGELDFVLGEQ